MDEETEGFEALTSHRGRQLYARMVSWEFSNPDTHQPVLKRNRRKSKKNSQSEEAKQEETTQEDLINELIKVSTGSGTESDGSEYFSAEEIVSVSDSEINESVSQKEGNESETESAGRDSVFESTGASECSSGTGSLTRSQHGKIVTRYRAPSKKQKRKRRQKYFGNDSCFPFSGLENMDVDFRSLKDDVRLQGEMISVVKQVPSLVELCILASQKIDSKIVSQCLPLSMKKVFQQPLAKIKLQKLQLSWLFQLLSYCEPQSVYERRFVYSNDEEKLPRTESKPLPVSNVFSARMCLKYEPSEKFCPGNLVSAYVPFNCILDTECFFEGYNYSKAACTYVLYSTFLFLNSAVATTINLMLPPSLPGKKLQHVGGGHGQTEADMLDNILLKSLTWVKYAMKKRFPTCTERVFDKVLPYVFWARGDVSRAFQEFLNLAEKESRDRFSAMYMYEIGRMNLHFQEPDVAITFFRRAADAAVHQANHQKKIQVDVVNLQTAMLIADVYDQGVMTTLKAQQVALLWQQVFKLPENGKFVGIGIYAVDSLLCYHGYEGKDEVVKWLDSVIGRLTEIAVVQPVVFMYLSMVHAWKGDKKSASDAYRNFLNLGFSGESDVAPGLNLKKSSKQSRRQNPWQILVDTITLDQRPPRPLQVLWRTRLLPANFAITKEKTSSYSSEADIRGNNLNLRVNENGYLTGDLQMLLPPINKVQLDLYTGKVCFPSMPCDTEAWKSLFTFVAKDELGSNLVPTPVEVYRDSSGNTVHQISASMMGLLDIIAFRVVNGPQFLIWTGADGKRLQINLVTKAKDELYNTAKKELEGKKSEDSQIMKRALEILKRCYNKNMMMDAKHILVHAQRELKENTDKSKKKPEYKADSSFHAHGCPGQMISSSTLVVPVICNTEMTVLLFVDCSSRDSFVKPKTKLCRNKVKFSNVHLTRKLPLPLPMYERFHFPYADLCSMFCCNENCDILFDTMGEEFDRIDQALCLYDEAFMHYPMVIRDHVIFINEEKRITSSCNGNVSVCEHFGKISRIDTCAHVLIMATENGLKFADGVSLLPLNVNMADNPKDSMPDLLNEEASGIHFGVIGEKDIRKENRSYKLAAIVYDTFLVLAEIPCCEEPESVDIRLCIEVPGHARDICFLGSQAGFFLSVTQHCKSFEFYREHLYQYSYQGNIVGILPCLGPGPRSFCQVMLPSNPDSKEDRHDYMKRHVYMRDGHGAIICVLPYSK